ncbi:restriction endonuclease subunit S [Virgibacillus indicus]|uniref:restriction endonuclease subunit S n=1 Tax=Virgibacillus indicus TaxID=2024554 RepID=UPI0013FDBBF6|nr:restriction endonuclease subunit S [Virgibacillus indicus]
MKAKVIKKEYYKTEVGEIPTDWKVKRISEIAEVNANTIKSNTPKDYEFFYYDLSAIDKGRVSHPNEKIKFRDAPSRAKRLFDKSNILMSTVRPNLQGFAFIDFDTENCVSSTGFAVIKGKDRSDSMYLYQNLYSYGITNQINRLIVGSNYPAINSNDVKSLKIPYPQNKSEREKITTILSTWDKAIVLKEKLIEQKKEQKKGIMQKLLTGELRLPGYKEKWNVVGLAKIAKLSIGLVTTMTTNYVDHGVSLIRNSDILPNKIKNYLIKLDKDFANKHKGRMLKKNDIVTVHTGEVGVSAVIEEELDGALGFATLNTRLHSKEFDPYFISYYFNSQKYKNFALRMSTGDGRNNFNLKDFRNSKVPKVPIKEQKAIVEVLSSIDKEIQLLMSQLDEYKTQKKGLMQLLLTGKVRVKA